MKYRIANRFRFTLFVTLLFIIMFAFVGYFLNFNSAKSLTVTEYLEVEVLAGDTLWDIAGTHMTAHEDIRKNVYELCEINNITAADLKPGMILRVPVAG